MDSPQFSANTQHPVAGSPPSEAAFPVNFANQIAELESFNKHLYRPNTYLHKWWARRCGSTFRLILKHLVDDPARRGYYRPGGLEGKIILDPMMGGGTTLHEAIRLGANVIGADIDPIPILQARATLSQTPPDRLEKAFGALFEELSARLSPFFETSCPDCGRPVPLMYTLYGQEQVCGCGAAVVVDSIVLRHEPDGSQVVICERCGEVHRVAGNADDHVCIREPLTCAIREKRMKVCPDCGESHRERRDIPFYARFVPIAIVGQCQVHGLFFKAPALSDLDLLRRANSARESLALEPATDFAVVPGPKSVDLIRHGIGSYLDLFSSRQLLYLSSAVELVERLDGLSKLNLGLLVSTSTEFNSMLCGYKGGSRRRPGAIRHTFSLHAFSFPYTALENNPVYPGKPSGSLQGLYHARIRKARQWAAQPRERVVEGGRAQKIVPICGEVDAGQEVPSPAELVEGTKRFLLLQGSSTGLNLEANSVDHVVTDPPYFDNVQYGDLSAFFRVWLKRIFADQAAWDYDLDESAVDPQSKGRGQYEAVLAGIFAECRRVLKPGGRLIFTYHHWSPKGWSALTSALKGAGFKLLERHIIQSENPASVHISNLRALKHDAVLILGSEGRDGRAWPMPIRVDTQISEDFIRGCADALGWMLSADLEWEDINQRWEELLR